jgi:hypothetical protein
LAGASDAELERPDVQSSGFPLETKMSENTIALVLLCSEAPLALCLLKIDGHGCAASSHFSITAFREILRRHVPTCSPQRALHPRLASPMMQVFIEMV